MNIHALINNGSESQSAWEIGEGLGTFMGTMDYYSRLILWVSPLVSGWSGSNRRPPVPKTGALPLRHTPFINYSSNFDDILSKKSSKSSDIGEFWSMFSSNKFLSGFEKLES